MLMTIKIKLCINTKFGHYMQVDDIFMEFGSCKSNSGELFVSIICFVCLIAFTMGFVCLTASLVERLFIIFIGDT